METDKSLEKIKEQADSHARSLVAIVRAVERKYGEEGKRTVKEVWLEEVYRKPWKRIGESVKKNDVQTLAKLVEKGCIDTHEWERIIDEPNKVAYRFTKCRWAEIFRELGATDIGKWFCDSDPVYVEAFNPKIKFKRTKTLMDGDECCDHVFYVEG
jgi:hypothetical protein